MEFDFPSKSLVIGSVLELKIFMIVIMVQYMGTTALSWLGLTKKSLLSILLHLHHKEPYMDQGLVCISDS